MSKPEVVVVTGDRQDGKKFCGLLGTLNHSARLLFSLEDLQTCLQESSNVAVILDMDTVSADKQLFRALKKIHPRLHVLGISSLAYHPGLEEVIGLHLYACLVKPLDTEELAYWLKTIGENLAEGEVSPRSEIVS